MEYFLYLCILSLYLISVLIPPQCVAIPYNKPSNCTCFPPEVSVLLNDAHTFMEEQDVGTLIAYLNYNNDTEATRQDILQYYLDSFHLYWSLYENIKEEFFWDSSCKLRSPLGWYLGHTASFYNNKLRMTNVMNREDDPLYDRFDYMFAQGVDELDWKDYCPQHPSSFWPEVETVKAYCVNTKDTVQQLILTTPLTLPITKSDPIWWPILMGIEHERIHLETSGMLIRQLPINKFKAQINGIWSQEYEGYRDLEKNIPPDNQLIPVEGKEMTYGRASKDLLPNSVSDFFGWDGEYGSFTIDVPDFNVSKYLVSNYEYYAFYQDDGYGTREYWEDTAWKWLQETNTTYPKFWIKNTGESDSEFKLRNTFTEIEMSFAWNRPVITNHYEADAFIRWKSHKLGKTLRLITEDEWYVLRTLPSGLQFARSSIREWDDVYGEFIANINFHYYSSEVPVDIFEFGNSSIYDVVGNVWHHSLSYFHPFEGYEVDPLYVDFTTPFFNSSYFLMKGGSYLSSGNMAMIYNRCEWFRAHYFQAAGIRYVESPRMDMNEINEGKKTTAEYFKNTDESNAAVFENINSLFSVNPKKNNYRNVVTDVVHKYVFDEPRVRKLLDIEVDQNSGVRKVLDIGCAIGGVAYELMRKYSLEEVVGVDDRARFVGLANRMQQNRLLDYNMKDVFGIEREYTVSLKELKMNEMALHRIRFVHDKDLKLVMNAGATYDLIVGENMLSRYYQTLRDSDYTLDRLLDANGIVVLFEDYQWNTEGVDVMQAMQAIVGKDMILKEEFETIPIVQQVYESSRISQQYSLHCTVWIKS
eukprot:43097_1